MSRAAVSSGGRPRASFSSLRTLERRRGEDGSHQVSRRARGCSHNIMIHSFVGLSLLFSACTVVVAQEWELNGPDCGYSDPSRRIVNGSEALEDQFPWMVFLQIGFGDTLMTCGGSIITKRHVLTAGHCTVENKVEAKEITVIYGHSDHRLGQKMRATKMLRHEEYDASRWYNDIAILLVEGEFQYEASVMPICLPTSPVDIFNQDVIVAGWGYLKEDGRVVNNLRYTVVKVLPDAKCAKKYEHREYRPDIMYCAYRLNTDACQGDSGGPLFILSEGGRYIEVGIVSYGDGCAVKDVPGVYTRLDALMPWLKENIGEHDKYRDLEQGSGDEQK